MRTHNRYGLALEAIQYQGHSLLFKELVLAFQTRMESDNAPLTEQEIIAQRIAKITKRHTNLSITVKFDNDVNASAMPLMINANHPFMQRMKDFPQWMLEKALGVGDTMKKKLAANESEIDLAKGTVSGPFALMPFEIIVGTGLWRYAKLSAEEVTAIYLHELGHIFTFLERVTTAVTANMAIVSAVEALGKADGRTERVRIIEATADTLKVKVDAEQLADSASKPQVEAVFVRATMDRHLPSASGTTGYEMTGSEFVADQFANRHGAGKELATGLDKMLRWSGQSDYRRGKAGFIAMEAIKFVVFVIASIAYHGVPLLYAGLFLIWGDYETRVYDTPADRMKRIRQDMVQALKNPRLSKDHRAKLEADLKAMDNLISTAQDRRSLMNVIWQSLTPGRRRAYNDRVFQQDLEKIINNEVFVAASRLTSLASSK